EMLCQHSGENMANTDALAEKLAEQIREAIRLDRMAFNDTVARPPDENRRLASGHVAQTLAAVSRRIKDSESGECLTEDQQRKISDEIGRKLVLPNPSSLRLVLKEAGANQQLKIVSDIRHLMYSVTPTCARPGTSRP